MPSSSSTGRVSHVVLTMNDHAARLATDCSYTEAIQVYTKALTFVRQLLVGMNSMHPSSHDLDDNGLRHHSSYKSSARQGASPHPVSVPEPQLHYTATQNASLQVPMSPSQHDSSRGNPFVFSQLILSNLQHPTTDLANFLDTSSFTLIFNMALCHHLKTIEAAKFLPNGVDARADWLTALKLYELAFEMQAAESVEVPLVFVLGMLNNMSHLHIQLKNEQDSRRCLSILLTSLMHYVVTVRRNATLGMDGDLEDPLLDAYLPDFFGAVSCLVCPEFTCAEVA